MKSLFLLILMFLSFFSYSDELKLCTNISPPYQVKVEDALGGTSINVLDCIFDKMEVDVSYRAIPWSRCEKEVLSGDSDGIFSVTPNSKLSQLMHFSDPIALAKWYWLYADRLPNIKDNVGAIRGSIEESFLMENKYSVGNRVKTAAQLRRLLEVGRITGFISDEAGLENLNISRLDNKTVNNMFIRYVPLGVYFSNKFKVRHSDFRNFISSFNRHIYSCQENKIELSKNDLGAVSSLVIKLKKLSSEKTIVSAIKNQNRNNLNITSEDIFDLDRRWSNPEDLDGELLRKSIMESAISRRLKSIKLQSKGLFSEIIVMDNKGLNVGLSDLTSDYWQGDEAKFKQSYGQSAEAVFIDDIEFDQSSKKFQSQVSFPVMDPDTQKMIGAITVGVDVENALSASK